jgi:hypothetical protein
MRIILAAQKSHRHFSDMNSGLDEVSLRAMPPLRKGKSRTELNHPKVMTETVELVAEDGLLVAC